MYSVFSGLPENAETSTDTTVATNTNTNTSNATNATNTNTKTKSADMHSIVAALKKNSAVPKQGKSQCYTAQLSSFFFHILYYVSWIVSWFRVTGSMMLFIKYLFLCVVIVNNDTSHYTMCHCIALPLYHIM